MSRLEEVELERNRGKLMMDKQDLKKEMRKFIIKEFGKKCNEPEAGCPVCDAWTAFDYLFR